MDQDSRLRKALDYLAQLDAYSQGRIFRMNLDGLSDFLSENAPDMVDEMNRKQELYARESDCRAKLQRALAEHTRTLVDEFRAKGDYAHAQADVFEMSLAEELREAEKAEQRAQEHSERNDFS